MGRFCLVIAILFMWLNLGYAEPFTGTEVTVSFSEIVDKEFSPTMKVGLTNYMSDMAIGVFITEESEAGPAFIWRVFDQPFSTKVGMAVHVAASTDLWQGQEEMRAKNLTYQVEPRVYWSGLDKRMEIGVPLQMTTIEGATKVWSVGLTLNFRPGAKE